ncbi:SAP domain-containing ribonucleoprotein [Lingula anatina]|uniref:SAP domain-containing ribonucleoprotein n=1 Tax=Lingula anatina TaxID=7574 RepID=A0A1S3J1N5_LINAN|nr:SAP domain-containing ribonucleoprotein [Lingula anatina]|eukprot:XP_013404173.1 SAP domain-containing ribonucleoprotein [Lingula anatina]
MPVTTTPNSMADSALTLDDLQGMKVADLKTHLKNLGLPVSGNKADLVQRLQEHFASANEDLLNDDLDDVLTEDPPPKPAAQPTTATKKPVTVKPLQEKRQSVTLTNNAIGGGGDHVTKVSGMTDAERLAERAKKFGVVSEEAKKKLRAEKFGLPVPADTKTKTSGNITTAPAADLEKLKKRAERFGITTSSTLSNVDKQEKLLKRKERFGVVVGTTNSDVEEKKKKRAERFGLT